MPPVCQFARGGRSGGPTARGRSGPTGNLRRTPIRRPTGALRAAPGVHWRASWNANKAEQSQSIRDNLVGLSGAVHSRSISHTGCEASLGDGGMRAALIRLVQ
jgi:hypothetical protein